MFVLNTVDSCRNGGPAPGKQGTSAQVWGSGWRGRSGDRRWSQSPARMVRDTAPQPRSSTPQGTTAKGNRAAHTGDGVFTNRAKNTTESGKHNLQTTSSHRGPQAPQPGAEPRNPPQPWPACSRGSGKKYYYLIITITITQKNKNQNRHTIGTPRRDFFGFLF